MYPHSYALYPYFSPRSLPFTMHTNGSFRIRRVGEWLEFGSREDVRRTGGLAGGDAHISTLDEYVRPSLSVIHGTDKQNLQTTSRLEGGTA